MLPSSGTANIMGADAASAPNTVRRNIGVVFQAQSVDVKLSAAENLRHQGHLYGLSGKVLTSRMTEMLSRVGLADRANERVETFSGGMQRRVELAKGLLHRPSVLLLDEPTTGLDPGARRDLWKYLAQLRDSEGVTVLVTTHLMEEAERCDRLAILNEGHLVGLGTPAELKSEIGGDVVIFEIADPTAASIVAEKISARFALKATALSGKIRLEVPNAHKLVTSVVETFLGDIKGFSVSKPSLEDVFISRTGHRFWADAQSREQDASEENR
jgi:ABC-2 type transport system ATP-binding protein